MTLEERFLDAKKDWTEAVQPQTALERRLVKFITCQDWLLHRSLMRAMSSDNDFDTIDYEQRQRDLIQSIACLVGTLTPLREAGAVKPKKGPAKLVEMPKRPATSVGSEPPEAAPALHPFFPVRPSGDQKPKTRKIEVLRDAA